MRPTKWEKILSEKGLIFKMQKIFTKLNIRKYLEKVFPKQIYAKAFEAESQTLKEMLGAHSSSV